MPELSRITPAVPDIDILLCGSIHDRRLRILNEPKARNVHVEQSFGLYGKQRELAPPKAQLCALDRDPPSQCRPVPNQDIRPTSLITWSCRASAEMAGEIPTAAYQSALAIVTICPTTSAS